MTISEPKDLIEALKDGGRVERTGGSTFNGVFYVTGLMTPQEEQMMLEERSGLDDSNDIRAVKIQRELEGDEWFMFIATDGSRRRSIELYRTDKSQFCFDQVYHYEEV